MRTLYRERQAFLVEALKTEAGDIIEIEPSDAGMHQTAWLPEGLDDAEVSRAALARGVEARQLSAFYAGKPGRPGVELGYAAFNEEQIRKGAKLLAAAVRACLSARRGDARRRVG
jgi:GntR family transcriptional regulator/MocR family aminotransferase